MVKTDIVLNHSYEVQVSQKALFACFLSYTF